MKTLVLSILLLLVIPVSAQWVSDNFSDGDFSHNPTWIGDTSLFVVNTQHQLQLNSQTAGLAHLCLPSPFPTLGKQEWRFFIQQKFAPSANNYSRFYLASDQPNLNDSLNGYFLQFGEAGNHDAVTLFRQQGLSLVSICRGTDVEIATAFSMSLRVLRDTAGLWTLFTDMQGGTNFQYEASGTDTLLKQAAWLGVACTYTQSNGTRFYWDDVYAGPPYKSHILPQLLSLKPQMPAQLDVEFNIPVDSPSAESSANYIADLGLGQPLMAKVDSQSKRLVHLSFNKAFQKGIKYTLSVRHVANLAGDTMFPDSASFGVFGIGTWRVEINEVMANPKPSQGLPEHEYIELINREPVAVNLENWTLVVGKKHLTIHGLTIGPDSFSVICSASSAPDFDPKLPVFALQSFPSLNNSGATVTLLNDSGRVIHSIGYSDTWYANAEKRKGGWSLEQIDPQNPCGEQLNWKASENSQGGTPGRANSVRASNPDRVSPGLLRAYLISPDSVRLEFDKAMDSSTILNPASYFFDHGSTVTAVIPVGPGYRSVILLLSTPMLHGILYRLEANQMLTDCAGNPLNGSYSVKLAFAETVSSTDVVINEILSDPLSGGVKYVELVNRSARVADLKTLYISNFDTISHALSGQKSISTEGYLLFPEDYVLLSPSAETVKSQYQTANPRAFLDIPALPKMDIGAGTLALSTTTGVLIDEVAYSSSWQFPLLTSTKGVSLERMDFNRPSQEAGNWHSAAQTAGFGTPGGRNSEYFSPTAKPEVSLSPLVFSPDGDGYNDVLGILYRFQTPGYVAHVQVLDSRGRLIRTLIHNTWLGSEGTITWDGTTDNRDLASSGVYIVYFELFNASGTVKSYKLCCVLAYKH